MGKVSIQVPYRIIAKFGHDPLRDNGVDEVVFKCPYCIDNKGTPDTKGHLYVNTKTYAYHCHRCGVSGHVRYDETPKERMYHEDLEKDNKELLHELNSIVSEDKKTYGLKIPINKVTTSDTATRYLLERGFTYDQMEYYDMRVGNLSQEFGRIIIPNRVHDIVYTDTYSARTYIGQTPKYHNPSEIKKSEIVFNLHRIKEGDPIILVEGALTAVAAGKRAVASLGKTLSKSQACQIVQKKPSMIIVNYDYGAEEESDKACRLLYSINPNIEIRYTRMPDDRDSADYAASRKMNEYAKILSESKRYNPMLENISEII